VDLRDYVRILRRGWPIVLACVVLGLAAGIGLTLATTKVYQADVQVFVATSSSASPSDLANGNTFTQDRVQSYTSIANGPEVTKAVIKQLNLKLTPQDLSDKITADAPLNKVLVNLHVTDNNPTMAAKLANYVAAKFNQVVQQTEQTDANGKAVVKLTVIHPATVPTTPIKPNKLLNVGLGFVVGLLVGVGVVVLRDVLDNTVKGPADFEDLGVPVLGMVPLDKRTTRMPIAFRGDPHSVRSEAYRQLRTNLQFVNVDHTPRIIAVTSAIPGEGKTTTALNLAAALAEAGHRVCLIEADLRRPTIAKTLGLSADVGFTTVLIGQSTVEAALQNVGRNFAVLTSGPVPPNPSELLISEQARNVIQAVIEQTDYTIIDTAPLLPVTDGAEVAALADATVVVHRAGKTTRDQAVRSIGALEKVGEKPVGVVLNMVSRNSGRYSYEYDYYYTYRPNRGGHGKDDGGKLDDRDRQLAEVAQERVVAANGADDSQSTPAHAADTGDGAGQPTARAMRGRRFRKVRELDQGSGEQRPPTR
jgi:capsular exopolysaccharide synthesis family protein